MVDMELLKETIQMNRKSRERICAELNISYNTLTNRLYGRTPFTLADVTELRRVLNLTDEQVIDIFFKE